MIINLSPVRIDNEEISVEKYGKSLLINGEVFDFGRMLDGESLPTTAIDSKWLAGGEYVDMIDGEIVLTLTLPIPYNYSQEQAFPVPLENVPDGPVSLPKPLPVVAMREGEEQAESQGGDHE
ncbi:MULTISPECIES: hypothetical protein [Pseudomonas syringae group]|uniref:hypothetical protein n=1 Tax=Pseudomonas syringae group TaxID=136849 RepID=UPI0006B971EE|nr:MULTISPECIES: hypothetical protein [Pseudomonas syringae group]